MKTSVILFLIALIIRLIVIFWWRFDGLYGQDPYAYFQQAIVIAQNLPQGQPPPLDFFWPNGYPLLIALLMLFTGQTPVAGQLVSLLCGSLLSALVYLLSRDLWVTRYGCSYLAIQSDWAHTVAGSIIAVAGQPILSSVVIMADMPALLWATLSAWLVVRTLRYSTSKDDASTLKHFLLFIVAGATLALAIITRWINALIAPAIIFYVIFQLKQDRLAWRPTLLAIPSGLLILLPQLWLSLNKPGGILHSWLRGWHPANFWQRQFETLDGHAAYQLPVGLFYAQPLGHPAYLFPLLGLIALWGVWRLRQTKHWGALILLLGWAAPVYLFLAGIPYQNFRFGLTLYVPLVILTGLGLNDLLASQAFKEAKQPKNKGATLPLAFRSPAPRLFCPAAFLKILTTISLLGMLAWAYPMLNNFLTTQNHSKTIARQVEQSLPPQATLLTFGLTLTLQHYTQLNTLELFYFDENSLHTVTTTQQPLYLLLDLPNIETQWAGKTPHLNYQWLQKNTTLTKIAAFPPYVLFKADQPSNTKLKGVDP